MKKKFLCVALSTLLLALGFSAEAQPPKKVPRIGFIGFSSPSFLGSRLDGFRQGLQELGYFEGHNIIVVYRYAENKADRLPDLAAQLVRLNVDVIVTHGTAGTRAAKQATTTIPIVMATVGTDPVAAGLVASLARPGGNVTGLTSLIPELGGKALELLKEAFPKVRRVAVLWNPASQSRLGLQAIEATARSLPVEVQPLELQGPAELENVFHTVIKGRFEGLVMTGIPFSEIHRARIVGFALKHRLPTIFQNQEWVQEGGLMSYGSSELERYRRAATYVDKVLKGTKPQDLPVEAPTKFALVINLKTAKQIGLTIPPNMIARADRVIK